MNKKTKITGVIATAVIMGGLIASTLFTSTVFANLSMTANKVVLTSDAGQIEKVTVAPSVDLEWEGLDTTPVDAKYRVYVKKDSWSNWRWLYTEVNANLDDGGTTGNDSYSLSPKEIDVADDIDYEDLDADVDDSTTKTLMNVKVEALLRDANGNTIFPTPVSASDPFWVEVTNEPASADIGGEANTDGEPTDTE